MSSEVKTADDTRPILWKAALLAVVIFTIGVTVMFPRAVLQLILPDQTVYANGFSEDHFRRIQVGMNEEQVLSILGPPLEVVIEPENRQTFKKTWKDRPSDTASARRVWWDYSRPGGMHDSYNVRSIELSTAGKVVAIGHHFYQD